MFREIVRPQNEPILLSKDFDPVMLRLVIAESPRSNWSYLLLDKLCHLSPINVSYFIHLWSNSKWEAESPYPTHQEQYMFLVDFENLYNSLRSWGSRR